MLRVLNNINDKNSYDYLPIGDILNPEEHNYYTNDLSRMKMGDALDFAAAFYCDWNYHNDTQALFGRDYNFEFADVLMEEEFVQYRPYFFFMTTIEPARRVYAYYPNAEYECWDEYCILSRGSTVDSFRRNLRDHLPEIKRYFDTYGRDREIPGNPFSGGFRYSWINMQLGRHYVFNARQSRWMALNEVTEINEEFTL